MINKIDHYALENHCTIYDEEAMTALELAGRTAGKVNECVDQVNQIPQKIAQDVQNHINNGEFDDQIDKYAGELETQISNSDKKQSANLTNAVDTLNKRIDNIVSNPGDGTVPTEVVDARSDGMGTAHGSLHASIQAQSKQLTNVQNGFVYLGGNSCANLIICEDGSVDIETNGRWTYRGSFGTMQFEWPTVGVNIANSMECLVEDEDGRQYNMRIHLPTYHTLVFNVKDKLLHFRNHAVCDTYDIVLVQNSYANPMRGCIVDEWKYRNTLGNLKHDYALSGAYLYGGTGFYMDFQADTESETLDVTMYGRPTMCYKGKYIMCLFSGDMIESVKDSVSYPKGDDNDVVATFKIPGWSSLVFNHNDNRWHYRYRGNLQEGDVLAISTGYCTPLGGSLIVEWVTNKTREFEQYIASQNAGVDTPPGLLEFAGKVANVGYGSCEKFLFFTDPHLCEGKTWQAEFERYKMALKSCYEGSSAEFAICGGDWLGNSDTVAEAGFKLAFIAGQMRSVFGDNYFPIVGNHDTNYQGDTYMAPELISNLWNRPGYYKVQRENTTLFFFDSQLDWDLTLDDYKLGQCREFASDLQSNKDYTNIALGLHIYYSFDGTTNHTGEMGALLTQIAQAYNNRGTITVGDDTFNFSGCTGKVRFVLAGHNHGDAVTTENGIPVVLTTHTRDGGQPTFDMCVADYANNKLHLCRIGNGSSRTVNI
ncbi:MAG: metallophosphoesterase [Oscillospiraceae bacterium]|nr:metallophosphoesterase [Oscillospiraceae bacterium]